MVIGTTNGKIRDLSSFDQVTGSSLPQVTGARFYTLLNPLTAAFGKSLTGQPRFLGAGLATSAS
jgi:hypothetical protein